MKPLVRHCAIYTRKSSEEGLEQDFNTLDAQREACLAYITSQKAEGWTAVKEHYDDGGFSGGNLERPALKKLMNDIKAGKVHIVVVYKIDRLTRSLMDFAKLVEVFDAHGVTFVSVTQSFSTVTSMGRLTLNVLLSFAQFEREVAGERIRDKIAASKKKGMWMGGSVPLGYEVKDKALVVNEKEADLVRHIFDRYLALNCVRELKDELDRQGIKGKTGNAFNKNVLYWMLQNPIYIGQVRHQGQTYSGQHAAIIDQAIWDEVQEKLQMQAVSPRGQKKPLQQHLLQGLLFDDEGVVYSPVFTTKDNKRYRYYVSQNAIQFRDHPKGVITRLPAQEIETFVEQNIKSVLCNTQNLADTLAVDHDLHYDALKVCTHANGVIHEIIQRIIVGVDSVTIQISPNNLRKLLQEKFKVTLPAAPAEMHKITVPFRAQKSKRGAVVIRPSESQNAFDLPPHELRDLVRGVIWRDEHFDGMTIRDIAKRDGHSEVFVGRLIHQTFQTA